MNIAFLVDHFPKISETFILNQITGLMDRGHAVDIFALAPSNESKVHEDVVRYGLIEKTVYRGNDVARIPANKWKRICILPDLIRNHFGTNPAAFIKSLNFIKYKKEAINLKIMLKMAPFLGKDDYDVVHCHFGPNGNLGVLLKDLGVFNGKIITTFHGYDISQYIYQHGKNVYKELLRKGDLFLPISDRWKNELISMGCSENKIIVHHMGIDPGKYSFLRYDRRGRNTISLVSIGRFVEKKGLRYGIEAVSRVIKKFDNIEYSIIGNGEQYGLMQDLVFKLNMENKIKLLGWKTQEEIIASMENADILLAPSVTSKDGDQEGIPVVLMEAMAMGLPVVTTSHSGIPELVKDTVSGFLAPEGNVSALADKLELCIKDRDRWPEIGRAGNEMIMANFNVNILNNRLVDIYRNLLNQ